MDRRRAGSPDYGRKWSGGSSNSGSSSPAHPMSRFQGGVGSGFSTIKRTQNVAAKAAAQRLTQVMASQTADDDEEDDDLGFQFSTHRLSTGSSEREASALRHELDMLREENKAILDKLHCEQEKREEAEARAKELEKQIASLGGVSLDAKLLSRKEAALRQRKAALKAAKKTKDGRDGEVATPRSELESLKDEAATAVDQLWEAESEAEALRMMTQRKNDYVCIQDKVNILEGLELHTGIFNTDEQRRIVDCIYRLQELGRKGGLKERTYLEPNKGMRGKGRVTLQFGCCYNYVHDAKGNSPGILQTGDVDPMPALFKSMIARLVKWHVLPPTCVPDSCIVNIYEEGDCIPPHIDHHDFVRPFCSVSFLSECKILFGRHVRIVSDGEFSGSYSIALPVGSVLVLNGNSADVAKHCVPAVPTKRISITFRKMRASKRPHGYVEEPLSYGAEEIRNSATQPDPQARRRTIRSDAITGINSILISLKKAPSSKRPRVG